MLGLEEHYKTLIDLAVERNIIVYDPSANPNQPTVRLFERMIEGMSKTFYHLTDFHIRGEYLTEEVLKYIGVRSTNITWHIYSNLVWEPIEEYCFQCCNETRAPADCSFVIGVSNYACRSDIDLNAKNCKVLLGSY